MVGGPNTGNGKFSGRHGQGSTAGQEPIMPNPAAIKAQAEYHAACIKEMEEAFHELPEHCKEWVLEQQQTECRRSLTEQQASEDRASDILVARDANLIAKTLLTPEKIERFRKLSPQAQDFYVQGISEHHSGFTFSVAVDLAIKFAKYTQNKDTASE